MGGPRKDPIIRYVHDEPSNHLYSMESVGTMDGAALGNGTHKKDGAHEMTGKLLIKEAYMTLDELESKQKGGAGADSRYANLDDLVLGDNVADTHVIKGPAASRLYRKASMLSAKS